MIVLPYFGKLSFQICTRINRVMKNKLPHCNFRTVFQSKCKLINFFTFKDNVPIFLRFSIVYKFKYGACNSTYYGKTKRHFKGRMCEHLGVPALTGKRVKGDNYSVVKEHHLFCNHSSGFDNFSILASNNNDFKVTLMESLLINRDHPPFNKNRHSLPLELFDDWGTSFYHMIAVDWSDCSPHISIFHQVNGILFIDFNLAACDFLSLTGIRR